MKISFIKYSLILALSLTMHQLAQADSSANKKVVVDPNDQVIVDSQGNCVRTKWNAGNDKCAKEQPVVETQPKIEKKVEKVAQPEPKKEVRKPQRSRKSRSYLVFFDFDKAAITGNAEEIIQKAYQDVSGKENVIFELVGHTDLAGANAYNMRLSEKRVQAVEKELIHLGVTRSGIDTYAKGESEPLVETADGVREPQNRRVEINFYFDQID